MNEPRRLREECESSLERALLDAGVSYRTSKGTRERTLVALGLAGSAALSAAAIGTASSTAFAKAGWVKVLTLVSTVGAVTAVPVGYYAWQKAHEAPKVAVVASKPSAPVQGPLVPAIRREEPALVAAAPAEVPSPALPTGTPNVRAPKASVSSADLTAELGAIEKARSALAGGDASGALAQLDTYSRSYPRGRLALEAEVLRIDALARSGQRDAAKKRAELFVRRYPNSVLKARVRGYLGE
jgi:hypothetical protein